MLINSILDISKIQAGSLTIDPEPVKIGEVLNSCLLIIEGTREGKADRHQPSARRSADVSCRSAEAEANSDQLLSNAVKFTPPGGRVDRGRAGPARLRHIEITDNGLGMTTEELEIAKRPFGQVE